MKSYLSLIPIGARARRRQNRLTRLCIVFSVFMVTAVFTMAEMGTRMELTRLGEKHADFSVGMLFDSDMGLSLTVMAGVLFLLVLTAGVLMISGSISSSVAQRTKFFGLMRCIGMSKRQIVRFVRLEALSWCLTAVPVGLVLGILASWGLCAALRFLVREEFSNIPLFGISGVGIVCGALVGVAAVLLATGAPAKQAAKASPLLAASGNAGGAQALRLGALARFMPIETALGVHHAASVRKSLLLMIGSFALSIVLLFSFSVLIDFVGCLMPQSAAASDIDVTRGTADAIDSELTQTLRAMDGVKRVYGRRSSFGVPARWNGTLACAVDLISFDDFDLSCLKKDDALRRGADLDSVYGDSACAIAAWDPTSFLQTGDQIQIGREALAIAGLLKYDPFSEDGMTGGGMTLIVSDETYTRLTGQTDYALVMVQMTAGATDQDAAAIRSVVEARGYSMTDRRDQRTSGTYAAFIACVYAFLGVIALVTVLSVVNSISMSVLAKTGQYGAMRAVGMDERQLTAMIAAQAYTYALLGGALGCAAGLPLSRALYGFLITSHFPYARWQMPWGLLAVILAFVVLAAALAAHGPSKRLRKSSVIETMNAL